MTASDTTTRVVSESGSDVGPGQRLREAREAAQLTLAEVASRMRLEPGALEQLENDDYERLHGSTFVRGYLSGYARLLGLPERPILEAYKRHGYGTPALVSELGGKPEVHVGDFPVRMVTYVIAGLLVVLVVLWWQSRQLDTGTPERAGAAGESVRQTSGPPANTGGQADSPAAAVETSEPPAAQDPSETTTEGDTQPPPATMRVEQSDASDAPLLQAPSSEVALIDDSRPDAETGTESGSAADATAAAPGDESAAEAATEAGGATDSRPEIVVVVRDPADPADPAEGDTTATTADVEEEAAPAPRPAPLPGSDVLAIEFAAESWVEIYDRGGGRLFYGLAREGSEIVVHGAGPMRVLLGDVEGAVVAYNGEPYDLSRYQGRSVVHFTVGELSSTTAPEPPAPAAEEPQTREPTSDERRPSVADASGTLSTPVPEPGTPGSPPGAEPAPESALPAPATGGTPEPGTRNSRPDS